MKTEKNVYFCSWIQSHMYMQAFLLAAGLGTRLRPLTDNRPKALVEVNGTPLVKIAIDNLVRQGATRIVMNVHHFADQLADYVQSRQWEAEIVLSDERALLLDTGGGLKKAAPLFIPNEPILVYNVDILSHIDLSELLSQHNDSKNIATLAACQRETSRQLLFDGQKQLVGWTNRSSGEYKWSRGVIENYRSLAFSGISVISPQLLDLLPESDHPYPIIPAYLEISKNHRISYFEHKKSDWMDVGKPETLKQAQTWKPS